MRSRSTFQSRPTGIHSGCAASLAVARLLRQKSLAAVMAWVLAGPAFAVDRYTIDSLHSIPVFEFKHLGVTTQTGRFDKAGGTISMDPAARQGSVVYEIEAASLNMGFGTETPNSPGYHLFEVVKFPKITFRSSKLVFDDQRRIIAAQGQLTLLGVTKPIAVKVDHFKCSVNRMNKKMMCAGDVSASLKRSEFGMSGYIPNISDEIKISIPVEAYKD
jgi:polyisoprenoid-binding protein YceI